MKNVVCQYYIIYIDANSLIYMQILWSLCQICTTKQCFIFPISTGDLLHHEDGQSPLHIKIVPFCQFIVNQLSC